MANIYLPADLKDTIETLVGTRNDHIFDTLMELSIFAALVGKRFDVSEELATNNQGNEIPDRIFVNNDRDGLVYLLALSEDEDPNIFRDGNDPEAWKIFERYAAGGLRKIHQWLLENPADDSGLETLTTKILEEANEYLKDHQSEPLEIDPL